MRVTIGRLPRVTTPQEVLTEVEYRDPNGEARTVAGTASLWPARWLVGIQPDSWLASRTSLKVRAAVLDLQRRPVARAAVQVAVLERRIYSTRKRLVGGFYAFEHFEEVRRLGELCRGETDLRGRLIGFIEGKVLRRSALPTADLSIRKLMALEALSRYRRAAPRLLGSMTIEPNLWPTSAILDWWNVPHRVPEIPNRAVRLKEAEQIVRARLNLQGTTMGFSTGQSDDLWWLMVSTDVNAVRLVLHLVHRLLPKNPWCERPGTHKGRSPSQRG